MNFKYNVSHIYQYQIKEKKSNKRPMGHITHLRKQFKSINTYDYIITLIKRRKKNPLLILVLYSKKLESPLPKDAFGQDCLKLAHWSWRRGLFNFVNVFLLFCNYLPLEKGGGPSFEQT